MRITLPRIEGFPSLTLSLTASDVPQSIPTNELVRDAGTPQHQIHAAAAIISCENGNARWTVGSAEPSQASSEGHIMVANSTPIRLENPELVSTFQFCDAVVDQQQHAIMHITLLFERSVAIPR
jgi:hypothetical protein